MPSFIWKNGKVEGICLYELTFILDTEVLNSPSAPHPKSTTSVCFRIIMTHHLWKLKRTCGHKTEMGCLPKTNWQGTVGGEMCFHNLSRFRTGPCSLLETAISAFAKERKTGAFFDLVAHLKGKNATAFEYKPKSFNSLCLILIVHLIVGIKIGRAHV